MSSPLAEQKAKILRQARDYWQQLKPREQQALALMALFFGSLFLIYGLWQPTSQYREQASGDWQQQQQLLQWLQAQKPLIKTGQQSSGPSSQEMAAQPILTRVTNSAKAYNINIKRLQPEGDSGLRLWLDDAAFNKVIPWLDSLTRQQGLGIKNILMERQSLPGKVNVSLVLYSG